MTPLHELDFKFKNTSADYHLRKLLGILHRDELIVLCRDSQVFCNGDIIVRPDAVIWERGTNKFIVVEFKSRFLHGNKYSLYEYFQTQITAEVVSNVLEAGKGSRIQIEPVILYANGRKVWLMPYYENIFEAYDILESMSVNLPIAGSKLAAAVVANNVVQDESYLYDPDARERGILMHEWLLNPQDKNQKK